MMRANRRALITGLAALVASPGAAHTLYPQWVAYRRKHLLVGCHRKDMETYRLAQRLVEDINHALPTAKARVARAPHPERLASLIGTDQMEVAVLSTEDARAMAAGSASFAPYGRIPLTRIASVDDHILVADADLPLRHAWMLADSLHATMAETDAGLPLHPGAAARRDGLDLADLPKADP